MNLKKHLIVATFVRCALLWWMLFQGFAIFSDDGVIRLLLSQEWAKESFVSAQIPWLPMQFYLLGGLSKLTGLSVLSFSIFINMAATLFLPWVFFWGLPQRFSDRQKAIAVWVMALWPWPLWLGVSGLSEPIMWVLALGMWASYLKERRGWFLVCGVLLSLCRIEAWLWIAILALFWVVKDWKAQNKKGVWALLGVLPAFPVFWLCHQYANDQLGLSASMRMHHASKDYAASIKSILYFIIAFFTAPFWLFLIPSFWKSRKEWWGEKEKFIFVLLFYLSSVFIALATAVPQRNLVLPLLLLLPFFVEHSRHAWKAVLLLQLIVSFHPHELLRQEVCLERHAVANSLIELHEKLDEGDQIMLCLEDDPHRYLGSHLALWTPYADKLVTDEQPERFDNPHHVYPNWEKFIIYEEFPNSKEPLVNHWRSYKEGESIFEKRSLSDIKKILEMNQIKIVVTGRWDRPLHLLGYEEIDQQNPFRIFVKGDKEKYQKQDRLVKEKQKSRKKRMMQLFKGDFSSKNIEALITMVGL